MRKVNRFEEVNSNNKKDFCIGVLRRGIFSLILVGLLFVSFAAFASDVSAATLLRVYNPNSGEHHYTANVNERNHLVKVGWRNEGNAWESPSKGNAVYRLYNPNNGGDHHYTMNANEKNHLVKVGWRYEGVAWQSGGSTPVYRLYNPNAKTGTHHYTLHAYEKDNLIRAGWRYEGIGFYAGKDAPTPPKPQVRWTVWFYPYQGDDQSKRIERGTKFFNSEAEATKWIENYSDSVLVNNSVGGTYGVMSWN
ncbi:hypothetical protein [Enterococcus dongliensis]|uniref:hypothetical protein n=1 Tax=Enterococcus dongliensis TaxID=2559925 RepID=UPI00289335A4|nr:hypothetical protein [Enterococcus dongliensis]